MNKKILNTKEAMEYLGVGRRVFNAAVKQGEISFKAVNGKKYFPLWVLDKWLNSTINYIDCSSAATTTTPIYHVSSTGDGCELERLAERMMKSWQSNTASKDYRKYNSKSKTKPLVDCLA